MCFNKASISHRFFLFVLTTLACSTVNAQINCTFYMNTNDDYICQVEWTPVFNDENVHIEIGGNHLAGRSNDDVTIFYFFAAQVRFVLSQAYANFPNMHFNVVFGGLHRIQQNAFNNARNLRQLAIQANFDMTMLPAGAFIGASSLVDLNLAGNGFQTIHEHAFNGLNNLENLWLNNNQFRALPANVFNPLVRLQTIVLNSNRIDRLDGRIFANNQQLRKISASDSQIFAIERNFFDEIPLAHELYFADNQCISRVFRFDSREVVLQGFSTCFDNFDRQEMEAGKKDSD